PSWREPPGSCPGAACPWGASPTARDRDRSAYPSHSPVRSRRTASLPGLGHAQEHVLGIEDGQHEPAPAVEKSPLHNVHREEPREGLHHEGGHAHPPPPPDPVTRGEGGIPVRAAHEVLEVAIRL